MRSVQDITVSLRQSNRGARASICATAAGLACMLLAGSPAARATPASVVFQDFRNVFPFDGTYGDWQTGTFNVLPDSLQVSSTIFGGAYTLSHPIDLSAYDELAMTAKINSGNGADRFNVVLTDADGTKGVYSLMTSGKLNTTTFAPTYRSLSQPDEIPTAGTTAGVDLRHIVSYDLQGNFEYWQGAAGQVLKLQFQELDAKRLGHASNVTAVDFSGSKALGFTYLSWDAGWPVHGTVTPSADGLKVSAPNEDGGGGVVLPADSHADLSGGVLEVSVKLLPGNKADSFNLLMHDTKNVKALYSFSTAGLSTDHFTTLRLPLSNYVIGNTQVDYYGTFNPADVNVIEIQGDFSADNEDTPNPLNLEFGGIWGAPHLMGDANDDGLINAVDRTALLTGFSNNLYGWANGDFNGDGRISADDIAMFNFALATSQTGGTVPPVVPEPACAAVLALGVFVQHLRRARNNSLAAS